MRVSLPIQWGIGRSLKDNVLNDVTRIISVQSPTQITSLFKKVRTYLSTYLKPEKIYLSIFKTQRS